MIQDRVIHVNIMIICLIGSFFLSCSNSLDSDAVISTSDLSQELGIQSPRLTFTVSAKRDTLLVTEKGIALYVERGSFSSLEGAPIEGPVEISIKEAMDGSAIFGESISTVQSGNLLDTRGMLEIRAFAQGNTLQLAEGKSIALIFPGDPLEYADAQLYYGQENDQGIIEWKLAEEPTTSTSTIDWDKELDLDLFVGYENPAELAPDKGMFTYEETLRDSLLKWITVPEILQSELLNRPIEVFWTLFKDGDFEVYAIEGDISRELKTVLTQQLNEVPLLAPFYREHEVADVNGLFYLTFSTAENTILNNFTLRARQLGWVNCDIFWEVDQPKIDMVIKAPDQRALMKLVFNNYRTIVTGILKNDGYFHFYELPQSEPIRIITVYPDQATSWLSITPAIVENEVSTLESFEGVDLATLEKKLNEIF